MDLPERFSNLPAYAFPRLRALLDHHPAGGPVRHMTIGEPKHPFPAFVPDILAREVAGFNSYPPNEGCAELREAIAHWVTRRYAVTLDPDTQIMTANGTREALYNIAMALIPEQKNGQRPVVAMPNPFYQVYMIAAISVGAEPVFIPATQATGHLPDYASMSADQLNRCAAVYVCSPANPQGAVADRSYWQDLIRLAEKHDFRIFADECYSEIWRDAPPVGALEVARDLGCDPERVTIFQSLSKRSNLPGLRAGFIAGGPKSIAAARQLRAYSGAPIPLPLQMVAAAAWADEAHVTENRRLYQEKYALADDIFGGIKGYAPPQAGFFLWLPVKDGEEAALKAWTQTGVRVLPGAYLSRDAGGANPGKDYIRVAMVAPKDEVQQGLIALCNCIYA